MLNFDPEVAKQLGTYLTDLSYGSSSRSSYDDKGYPILRIPNVLRGRVDYSDLQHIELNSTEYERLALSKGDVLQEGDVLNTGAKGFAIIAFADGGKMTLRPNTTFTIEQFNAAPGQEAAVFRLLKGGLRAITGTIGRTKPDAVRINAATATIDIF